MSDTSSTFWRPVALFLLVALIGVYLLYEWYDDRLYEQLDTQEQALAEAAGHARQLDVELAEAVSRRDALSLELEQLRVDHDTTLAALEQRLATLRADKEALEQRYQTLHERHQSMAADLDSERAQASGAYAELEARYQQAEATIATLRDDLSRVHEAIAATAAEHRAHIETLERHLNERIHLSTTTPMDAELLRLAQNLGVVPSEADRQAIAELKTKLELLQEDYAAARAKHEADRAHLQQALEQAEARAAARETELDELKRAYDEALAALEARPSEDGDDDAVARLAELNRTLAEREARIAELEERLVAVGQQRAEASAALAARPSAQQLTELETALAAARTRIEGLEAELTSAAAGAADEAVLREQLAAREARVVELESTLAELEADHQALRAELEARPAPERVSELEQAFAEAQARVAELEDELAAFAAGADADTGLREQLAAREARVVELESTLAELEADHQALRAELEARPAPERVSELEQAFAEAQARVAELEDELAAFAAGADADAGLRERLAAREARVVELESTLAELEADHQALRAELEARPAPERVSELEQAFAEAQARVAELEDELAAFAAGADADAGLRERLAAREARVAELESQLAAQQARLVEDDAALAAQADDIEIDAQVETLTTALAAERERTAQVRALYQRLAELGASYSEQGMRLRLANDTLRFPTGAATLPAGELPVLDQIVALLADNPGLTLRIVGHTDSAGSDALNLELSRQRAEAVRAGLIERGLDPERVEAEGVGEAGPIASNATARGRASNRRVEVYVIE